jgi:nucleoside-diphosphate-sugar epimerase
MLDKVLVTGGAGFVGRHLVRRLLLEGAEVHCVDPIAPLTGGIHPDKGWPGFEPRDFNNFHFYAEDCRNYFKRVRDADFSKVFHLAAIVGGREMIEHNPLAVADDLSIDAEFWQWAKEVKPAKLVNFSSSAAYPTHLQRPDHYVLLKEDMIDFKANLGMPDMSYGWSKLTHEYLGRLAYEKHGLKSVIYRPFSGYGEDQHDSYPFPSICKRVLANQGARQLQVWGSGRQMRDFIHIEDCIDGVFATMDKVDDGSAINLSTGIFTSFIEFAQLAANICGYQPEVSGTSSKPEGVFARGGDTTFQKQLGFTASTSFESGVRRALDHFQKLQVREPPKTINLQRSF